MKDEYEPVIGLEIHAQLKTASKIFCGCSSSFGDEPNSNTCPICLGLPGALPVLNHRVIELAGRAALALNLQINRESIFSRKNYFYPDLPKGYQISQYDKPFSEYGWIEILTSERDRNRHPIKWSRKRFRIRRLHIEEDAGKSLHEAMPESSTQSYIDLNRSGIALIEIVSEPDLRSSWEAYDYMQYIHRTLKYINVCDGNMEEGGMRCDANVSVRLKGTKELGTRVELKNINSFRSLQKAIAYEIERQIEVIGSDETVIQETRLWDDNKSITSSMRSKEEAHDYRYFPEPDLPPITIDEGFTSRLREEMRELPEALCQRFIQEYELSFEEAAQITQSRAMADYYEATVRICENPKSAANWILNELAREMKNSRRGSSEIPVSADWLAKMIKMIDGEIISGKMAKQVFMEMYYSGKSPEDVVIEMGGRQVSDEIEIRNIAIKVINDNPKQFEQYTAGKESLFGFFVGETLKLSAGRANPHIVNRVLRELLLTND
jgi:aspartyl-tRNA(Asn)/glutamyl-tRNA(Gln) amidotransferase subunit B